MKKPHTQFLVAQFMFYWFQSGELALSKHMLWEAICVTCDRLFGTATLSVHKSICALTKHEYTD